MPNRELTPDLLDIVAARFKALGEPVRLQILSALRDGERTVNELVEITGQGQANVSKHLQLLHAMELVTRRRDGLHVRYCLADRDVFRLCDMMCGRIEAQMKARRRVVTVR